MSPEFYLSEAAKARRLAKSQIDAATAQKLEQVAREYEILADAMRGPTTTRASSDRS